MATIGFAQQNAQYNQYIFNELVVNPAYAGTKGIVNANAIYSKQWAGIDGAPTTQTIGIEGPVSEKIGLGLHLINDKIGAQSQQAFYGSYSYKLQLNDRFKLSMGLAVGGSYFGLNGTEMTVENPNDPVVPKTYEKKLRFDSKAGLFMYSDRFYAGLSVSDLLANVFKNEDLLLVEQERHYYLTSGYVFDITSKLKFKPSAMIKYISKSPPNIDLNSFFLLNERFWLGASYRLGTGAFNNSKIEKSLSKKDAVVFMGEFYINEKLRAGYAYTMTTGILKDYSSHEVSLGYYIPAKGVNKKMISVRYF